MSEKQTFQTELGGRKLSFEIGQIAKQADGAVVVRYEDTVILCTAVASKEAKPLDFFPLTVNYEERLYAAGKIPGGFLKREGRPSDTAVLTSRLIDRPIRPLFAEGFRNEVQVVSTVMSVNPDCSPEIAALIGSSLALSISDIPFEGPIAGVKVGRVDGQFIVNPTVAQSEVSDIDLVVAGTKFAINMVEAGADHVSEADMLEAILFGHEEIKKLIALQEEIVAAIGKPKREIALYEIDADLEAAVEAVAKARLVEAVKIAEKHARDEVIDAIKKEVIETYTANEADDATIKQIKEILSAIVKNEVRRLITDEKIRPDGRQIDEIRPLSAEIDFLPRTHGSGLFTRGQTQALSIATLGALAENQIIDSLDVEESKRFMHHYNFPPFSVGETGRMGAPSRRSIGHGALGERALKYVIPGEDVFPYTIRVVSEVVESNGSTSQASICAATLALMAAGVPIKTPVAGIAMGLVKSGENYTVLTDIQGLEDHLGDMDFKVAGSDKGITALQMDIKIDGIDRAILKEALEQALTARLQILNVITDVIAEPRKQLSEYAPKVQTMQIKVDKIRDVIGPGGKQINAIIDETGVKIDIEQDGRVLIFSSDQPMIDRAMEMIGEIVREVEVGATYHAKVVRIEKFGAFVELFPGTDALVHISQFAHERVEKVEDVVKLGDVIDVKVTEIDDRGRVNASRKALLPKPEPVEASDEDKKSE
ncbi:polyribonucleotide nucleotidyltransferase [Culicoidibacter larvae]|uniref:Polyribonucleotide nucleotidyltransferase n=1 Tax=Culicoidibacter larvae TaxID=2579976 RepID=A0A5R8QA10_9FIRM|nr:polyribonucleotide nucleotidyltransferase [Culicoidibacter larvae]TLG71802.1 polyribonucleotide nucleotidyltransferase [Culicoidibacter larvae]